MYAYNKDFFVSGRMDHLTKESSLKIRIGRAEKNGKFIFNASSKWFFDVQLLLLKQKDNIDHIGRSVISKRSFLYIGDCHLPFEGLL